MAPKEEPEIESGSHEEEEEVEEVEDEEAEEEEEEEEEGQWQHFVNVRSYGRPACHRIE